VKVLVRRSLYVRSLTGVLQFGTDKRDSLSPTSPLPLGRPGGCSSKKTFLKKEKFFKKTGETPSVTGGLRTGDGKKFESIRINLRDLAWFQAWSQGSRVFAGLDPWDQAWNHPWNPI
jgi:hypothetical protein